MKKQILVVEDEAITALDIEDMVEHMGHAVIASVDTGEDAVCEARDRSPDLVLMDIKLKGEMDGISAAEKIWKEKKIPVVFLTSYSDEATLNRAKLVQPYGYLLKPFQLDELRATIELALHRFELEQSSDKNLHTETVPQGETREKEDIAVFDFQSKSLSPYEFLKRVDPFRLLEDSELQALASVAVFKSIESGTYLVQDGENLETGFIVASGRLACIKGSLNGKELIVRLLGPGDTYALLVTLNDELSPFSLRVERDSTVLSIPISSLKEIFDRNQKVYSDVAELVIEHLRESEEFCRQLAHDKVEVRIAAALTSLVGNFAQFNRKADTYSIEMTRQELADLVGTSPETAIRITKNFETNSLLDLSRPGIIVIKNLEGLESLLSQ